MLLTKVRRRIQVLGVALAFGAGPLGAQDGGDASRDVDPRDSGERATAGPPAVALAPGGNATAGASEAPGTDAAGAPDAGPSFADELLESITGGDLKLNLRLRAEIVEQDGTDTSQAYTERLRLGYGTKPFHGLSLYAEFEDIRSADYDLYNAAGLNGEPNKAVVADPEDTELNQAYARYENQYFGAILGRQKILLDDVRFVGNVGWRQNEQTYDAYTLTSDWIPDTSIFYSYVDDVNRIFGPDSGRDFESDSHFVNVSHDLGYGDTVIGKLTAFTYLLDFRNSDANSSNTFGLRFSGSQGLSSDFSLTYTASYAHQVDAADNPTDYETDYYYIEGAAVKKGLGRAGLGYEVLGSDSGDFGFRTPLATLHKWNGWADIFLTTPNDGLEDLYFFVGAELPAKIHGLAVYHLFFSEDRSRDFGGEFDALLRRQFGEHIAILGKLAIFHGESQLPSTQKYWLQMELLF